MEWRYIEYDSLISRRLILQPADHHVDGKGKLILASGSDPVTSCDVEGSL